MLAGERGIGVPRNRERCLAALVFLWEIVVGLVVGYLWLWCVFSLVEMGVLLFFC